MLVSGYEDSIHKVQRVLDAPWRERSLAFANAFDAPITLVTGRFESGAIRNAESEQQRSCLMRHSLIQSAS